MKKIILFLILTIFVVGVTGCGQVGNEADIWSQAMYTENTELGTGEKIVLVEVVAEDKSITFTIHSDKDTLKDALLEYDLIDGEQGPYGLYAKKVNGITADYDINQCYWGFYKNDESMNTGVDATKLENGDSFKIVYTK